MALAVMIARQNSESRQLKYQILLDRYSRVKSSHGKTTGGQPFQPSRKQRISLLTEI